jgi:TatD DNase family protein
MVRGFLDRGAFFSFSPYFLHERKAAQREIFRELPSERILVETDAPDLAPPPEKNPRPLHSDDGRALNHPLNLLTAYDALAEIRGTSREELAPLIAKNFLRLFGLPWDVSGVHPATGRRE